MEDELREWRSFVAVAEHASFTRAAAALGISQPNLSRHIASLERRLGLQLFDRGSRLARPTDPGAELVPRARELLGSMERLLQHATRISHGDSATLRLGASAQTLVSFVAAFLGSFTRHHPEIDLRLAEGAVDHLLDAVRAGRLEFAVVSADVAEPLNSVALYRADVQLVVPSRSAHRHARIVEVEELQGTPLLLLSRASVSRRLFDAACEQAGVAPEIRLESENAQALVELVQQGYGSAVLPSTASAAPRLVRRHTLAVKGRKISTGMHLVWHSELYHSRAAVLLHEEIRRFAREHRRG